MDAIYLYKSKSVKTLPLWGILLLLLTACTNSDKVVATIEGDKILKSELVDLLMDRYGEQTLDELVGNMIISKEKEANEIVITEEDVQKELDFTASEYGGEEALKNQLEASGMSMDELKSNIERYLVMKTLVEPLIDTSDDALELFFKENRDMFDVREQVLASHILLDDEETALEVLEKLNNGGKFDELAKEYSKDLGTAEKGGDLGFFGRGEMIPEFEEVAFSMGKSEISEPVKSQYGYHIIKVMDKQEGKEAKFEDVKERVRQLLIDQQLQYKYPEWLEGAKERHNLVITLTEEEK